MEIKELAPFEKMEKYQTHLRAKDALPNVLEAIAAISKTHLWPSQARPKIGTLKNHLKWLLESVEADLLNDDDATSLKMELDKIYG